MENFLYNEVNLIFNSITSLSSYSSLAFSARVKSILNFPSTKGFASKSSMLSYFCPYAIVFLINGKILYFFDAVWISKFFFNAMQFVQLSSLASSCGAGLCCGACPQAVHWAPATQQKGREGCKAKSSLFTVELLHPRQLSGSIATSSDLSVWCFYAIAAGKGSTREGWRASPDGVILGPTALATGRAEGKENYIYLASDSVLWLMLASGEWSCQTAVWIFGTARWSHQAWHAVFPSVHGHILIFSLLPLSHATYIWTDTLLKASEVSITTAPLRPNSVAGTKEA